MSLYGLENIGHDSAEIKIRDNDALIDISSLENIYIYPNLDIENNASLSNCAISSVCQYLQKGEKSFIENNAPGCNVEAEILAQCPVNTNNLSVFPL